MEKKELKALTAEDIAVKNNENTKLCTKCGGSCCKQLGGSISPLEIGDVTEERIRELLDTGAVSIDWYEGDVFSHRGMSSPDGKEYDNMYFLRMRNKDGDIIDPSFGGECMMLTDKGCRLQFNERPYGCRSLYPTINSDGGITCVNAYDKAQSAIDWLPYEDILDSIVNELLTRTTNKLMTLPNEKYDPPSYMALDLELEKKLGLPPYGPSLIDILASMFEEDEENEG